ncbi:glycoside hydrolase family 27 protein [Williamsia maris]|uniref:Alpha-galactosidase n=1 Tax=Williamsia maris TaxID=72806 RepID=A0ABT1H7V1_9NOCA|nr:glycoside hydrolase family 27 protein [Williamsia maris]MCP2174336.1 alpha-galactosidase [Williamsia maris]
MRTSRTARAIAAGAALCVAVACAPAPGSQIDDAAVAIPGVAATPPMGWNSWNSFGCDIDETTIRAQADALVSSGLAAAGYRYVVVDDCWYSPQRAADGTLTASPQRFPSGMAALGDYLHERGLRFGIYAGASEQTCAQLSGTYPGRTGSAGHEATDARTFASWGVDFVKYDWCSPNSDLADQKQAFVAMRDAIRATGRPMVYSINPNSGVTSNGEVPGARWDWGGVATMTRLTNDISPQWTTDTGSSGYQGVADIIDASADATPRVSAGRWTDLDMLEIGVGTSLTAAQQRSHLALWAMMAAPLVAGNDLTVMDPATAALLRTPGVLAIDQDPGAHPATSTTADGSVRTRELSGGRRAVSLSNRGATATKMSFTPTTSGPVHDAWTGAVVPVGSDGTITVTVAPGDTALFETAPGGSDQ